MTKKIIFIVFILFYSVVLLNSEKFLYAETNNFLWKVRSKTSTAYILGSIHFMKKEHYPLNKTIEDAFNKSEVLAVEANVNDISKIDIQKVLGTSFYTGDDSLEKHISGDTFRLLKTKFESLGFPLWIINKQKPWFLALTLVSLELMQNGYDPQYGLDMYFLSKANNKKIKELESIDYQINLLSEFSDMEQEAFLLYSIKNSENLSKDTDDIIKAWREGNASKLESIIINSFKNYNGMTSVYRKLVSERNEKMALRIEKYLESNETHFIIVGAGHLVGRGGIIELLKNKGYIVEQM
ncbi:MAG: TraB/GumN family protein [Nitrospirae bacterium]|jgi:uncharacterized protein YbaP (TraB family)|nr:TraB/GumN family protein [Nitrospirota bacterium]